MRLVDISPYEKCRIVLNGEDSGFLAKELPTADAVEVVRCRECGFYGEILGQKMCKRQFTCIQMNPNDFCSYGVHSNWEVNK